MRTLLAEVNTRLGSAQTDLILGGFSQGGMVSAEVAFRSDTSLRALVLLSPTIVDEASWRQGLAARRGLPVLLAHGRLDAVLAFAPRRCGRDLMREAGLDVTWVPFDGGHEMPPSVVEALNAVPREVRLRPVGLRHSALGLGDGAVAATLVDGQ